MSLLCELFGHKTPTHHSPYSPLGGGDYLEVKGRPKVDGIGRSHFTLLGTCSRCGETFKVGMVHGHQITRYQKEPSHDNQ